MGDEQKVKPIPQFPKDAGILENPDYFDSFGGASRPIHTVERSKGAADQIAAIEHDIRDRSPFKGNWQTYVTEDGRLYIPENMRKLLQYGGVVTTSVENHLLLFGKVHWERFQRMFAPDLGLNPKRAAVGRHLYSHALEFNKVNDDGTITLNRELIAYASIDTAVALVGLTYYAEVYNLDDYHEKQMSAEEARQAASE